MYSIVRAALKAETCPGLLNYVIELVWFCRWLSTFQTILLPSSFEGHNLEEQILNFDVMKYLI
jgi:hypothetical protein